VFCWQVYFGVSDCSEETAVDVSVFGAKRNAKTYLK